MDLPPDARQAVNRSASRRLSAGRRLLLLLACLAAGLLVGAAGHALTGEGAWLLAVPVVVAFGWWFVADPRDCTACGPDGRTAR